MRLKKFKFLLLIVPFGIPVYAVWSSGSLQLLQGVHADTPAQHAGHGAVPREKPDRSADAAALATLANVEANGTLVIAAAAPTHAEAVEAVGPDMRDHGAILSRADELSGLESLQVCRAAMALLGDVPLSEATAIHSTDGFIAGAWLDADETMHARACRLGGDILSLTTVAGGVPTQWPDAAQVKRNGQWHFGVRGTRVQVYNTRDGEIRAIRHVDWSKPEIFDVGPL